MNYLEMQKNEAVTVKGRSITLELSDMDCEKLFKKAGIVGMSVEKLLENFVGDLVAGTYSNGSDERECANT